MPLGAELLGQGLLWFAMAVPLVRRSLPGRGDPRSWFVGRVGLVFAALVPFAVAGASLLAEAGGGLYWLVGGMVAALMAGVATAWVLLVEILR